MSPVDRLTETFLSIVDNFKSSAVRDLFSGISGFIAFHAVSAAEIIWSNEFGLDPHGAASNSYSHLGKEYVTTEKRSEFKKLCRAKMLDAVFSSVKETCQEDVPLWHEIQARLLKVLSTNGILESEIEEKIQQLLPIDEEGTKTVTPEAIKMLLIDIGVFYRH